MRGALLKLRVGREDMDLLFNTGSTSIFENHMTFAMNAMANAALEGSPQNLEAYKRWLYVRPANYYNLIDMMVKGPSSYTKLHYYTKFPVLLTSKNIYFGTSKNTPFWLFLAPPADSVEFLWFKMAGTGIPHIVLCFMLNSHL